MQSTEEAVHYGIPIVGFPVFWDQIYNVRNMKKLGVGAHLHRNNISKESIEAAVHEVINNKKYYSISYIYLYIYNLLFII